MASKSQPILIDSDTDDPDVKIVSHKQSRSHTGRSNRPSSEKEPESIIVLSSSDNEGSASVQILPNRTIARKNVLQL
jgi:hypothetical protein